VATAGSGLRITEEKNRLVRRICSRSGVVDDVLDRADAAKRHRSQIVGLDVWGVRYFVRVGVYNARVNNEVAIVM
jgi:hypothetical protein